MTASPALARASYACIWPLLEMSRLPPDGSFHPWSRQIFLVLWTISINKSFRNNLRTENPPSVHRREKHLQIQ